MRFEIPKLDPSRILPEPTDVCPECHGRGWKVVPDGGAGRAEKCNCDVEENRKLLLARAGIPKRYQGCTINDFKVSGAHRVPLANARNVCQAYVELWKEHGPQDERTHQGLLLIGPAGTGKTHLVAAVLAALIRLCGVRGCFVDFNALLYRLRSTFGANARETRDEVLEPLLEADVLVLDDLGVSNPTGWVAETLYHVLNTRYAERRATLVTTNYQLTELQEGVPEADASAAPAGSDQDVKDMTAEVSWLKKRKPVQPEDAPLAERISARLVSRLYEMTTLVQLQGVDYRRYGATHAPPQSPPKN